MGDLILKLSKRGSAGILASGFSTLAEHLGGFVATKTTAPLAALFLVFVSEVSLGSANESGKLALVFALNILEGDNGSCLLVHNRAQTSLALHNNIRHTHLAAESRDEDNELNGVDVVRDDDEGRFFGLNEGNTVVETIFDKKRLLVFGGFLLFGSSLCDGLETLLLLDLGFGAVLIQELKKLRSSVLVQGVGELGDGRGHLQALAKDDLLALKANILRPFDEARQVSLGADVLTDTEISRLGLEERVFGGFGGLGGSARGGSGFLARTGLGLRGLVIETRT